jgi:hypothetical protein
MCAATRYPYLCRLRPQSAPLDRGVRATGRTRGVMSGRTAGNKAAFVGSMHEQVEQTQKDLILFGSSFRLRYCRDAVIDGSCRVC